MSFLQGWLDSSNCFLDRILNNALTPPYIKYAHEQSGHDGHSHVQVALLGPSVSIPVRDGNLTLGTWQLGTMLVSHKCE